MWAHSYEKAEDVVLTDVAEVGLWQSMLNSLSAKLGAGIRIVNNRREVILQSGLAALCREAMKRAVEHPACLSVEGLASYDEGSFALCPYCERAINFVFNLRIDGIQAHVIVGPVWIAEAEGRPSLARMAKKFGISQAKFAELSGKLKAYFLEEFRKTGEMVLSTMRVIAHALGASLDLGNQVKQIKEALAIEKKRTWQDMVQDRQTGAFNYNYGIARLKEEVARAERYEHPFCIVVIGIERFPSYINRRGPEAGNAFLEGVAALLQKKCRRTDLIVRLGEQEFLLILPSTVERGARSVLDRLRGELKAFSFSDGRGTAIRAPSLVEGLASYPKDGKKAMELLHKIREKIRR